MSDGGGGGDRGNDASAVYMEQNVVLGFLAQATVVAAVFAVGVCWFSCLKRYFERIFPQPYWLRGDGSESGDDPESGGEGAAAAAVKKYPVDPPPAYNQADLFTQQELKACDVLYPPPAYSDLNLLPILADNSGGGDPQQQCQRPKHDSCPPEHPPSPVPHLAFEDAVAGARRSSAPVSSSLEDGNSAVDIRPACPVGVHRHSIAVIADDSLPCGLVRPPTEVRSSSATNGESSRSSSATARWLEAIFHHLRARRRSNDESVHRRRQTDHPYYPPNWDPREEALAFQNLALELRDEGCEVGNIEVEVTTTQRHNRGSVSIEVPIEDCQDPPPPPPVPDSPPPPPSPLPPVQNGSDSDADAEEPPAPPLRCRSSVSSTTTVMVMVHSEQAAPS